MPQQKSEDRFYLSIVDDDNVGYWLGMKKTNNGWKSDSGAPVTYGIYGEKALPFHNGSNSEADEIYASSFRVTWYTQTEERATTTALNVICTHVCRLRNIY